MSPSSFHPKFAKPVLWGLLLTISTSVQFVFCIPSHAEMLTKTPQGVSIKVDDRPLTELIKEIQSKTGIQIKAPDSMKAEKVTARIEATNEKEAVELLFRDFNHIKLSGPENEKDTFLLLGGRLEGGPIDLKSASLSKAPLGKKTGKRVNSQLLSKKLRAYKEQAKKRREEKLRQLEERKRKLEERKEYERLTGSPPPSPALNGSRTSWQSKPRGSKKKAPFRPRRKSMAKPPKNGFPDPALVQKKLELYRLKMQQSQQNQQ